MSGLLYIIKSGDTLTKIATRFQISSAEALYNHPANSAFREDFPNLNKIAVGAKITIPSGLGNVQRGAVKATKSSESSQLFARGGWRPLFNMHMHFQSNNCCPLPIQWGLSGLLDKKDRKQINSLAATIGQAFTGRFGKLGRLRTDLIAGIYWGSAANRDMPEDNKWVVDATDESAEKAGKRADITKLSTKNRDQNAQGYKKLQREYYGEGVNLEPLSVGLMMDLSFGHFWGRYGLPVNLSLFSENQRYFLNDYAQISKNGGMWIDYDLYNHPLKSESVVAHALAPQEITWQKIASQQTPFSRGINVRPPSETSFMHKQFTHLVSPLPGYEAKHCEEFPKQLLHTEGAVVRFPLQQFALYHFDPRRHYVSREEVKIKAQHLFDLHGFATVDYARKKNFFDMHTPLEFTSPSSIEILLCHRNGLRSVDEATQNLVTEGGLFWGFKMYPRLGYRPDSMERYPSLHKLYTYCAQQEIPITAHCSRGGMAIADYQNYMRYSEAPVASWEDPKVAEYAFADYYTSPASWKKVLITYPQLKLNLAHFGGFDLWYELGPFEALDQGAKMLPQGNEYGNFLEKSALFNHWVRAIPKLMASAPGLYTDISYFHLENHEQVVAQNMIWMITRYPILKERIMLGTDWYMTEMEKMQGDGPLLTNLYKLLEEVTTACKFDAWHQFTVINPMKFMGLIEEKGGKMQIKTERLEGYKSALEERMSKTKWCKKACALPIEPDKIKLLSEHILSELKRMPLYTGQELYGKKQQSRR